MRARSVPVVLTSVTLAGWLGGAMAQEANPPLPPPTTPPGVLANPTQQPGEGSANLAPGEIPQPTPDNPGVVLGVTLGELYTDNLKLAGSGQPKESAWITSVQPFIRAAYSAPRFSGMLNYSLTGYLYAGKAGNNQLSQNLDAMGTAVIAPQHLFLDGTVVYGQQIVNNQLPSGSGTFFLNNNLANVGIATLSPYWTQDLGRVGTAMLRYTRGRVVYNQNGISGDNGNVLRGIPNYSSNAIQFNLTSPAGAGRWGWSAAYTQQTIEPDADRTLNQNFNRNTQFAQAEIGASYQIGTSTQLLVDVGKENNFLPSGKVEHLGAKFWDAGVQWANARDSFKVLFGHRFYGRSAQLSWTHQAARLTTVVSYVDQPTDLNQQLMGQNPGELITTPGGSIFIPSLRDRQVYIMRRASASATYQMPRGNLRVTLYDESRRYIQLGNEEEKIANASLGWTYDVGPLTTFTPTVGWQRYRFIDQSINYTRFVQLALTHQFTAKDFASLRYRNDSQGAFFPAVMTESGRDYRVNVVYLEWTHLF